MNLLNIEPPFFLLVKEEFDKNISDFQNALNTYWPNSILSYSVKTNSLPWVLEYMKKLGAYAEVVSDEEYLLALKCGFKANQIIFNGPIKSRKMFEYAVANNSIVNIDSKKELSYIQDIKQFETQQIGLRLNADIKSFNPSDISFHDDGFRFGFCEENGELKKAIETIGESKEYGLHIHCNSLTRSLDVYISIATYLAKLIKKNELRPAYIDIGGGFFGGVEGKPTADQYIKEITKVLKEVVDINKTKLIIEPGSAVIASAVDFHTEVRDAKDTLNARIVTTDGSRINIDPLWKKTSYFYTIVGESTTKNNKQIVCGYTCMDYDRIMLLENEKELNIGDRIIYHKVGSYTITFGGAFISYFPPVYLKDSNGIKLIRDKIDTDDYYTIHALKGV